MLVCAMTLSFGVTASASAQPQPAAQPTNWTLTRAELQVTASGIEISQTEMGTPDNHAIAILEVPFENAESFEITVSFEMDEYVESGRGANDVWAGIGVMGKPEFINWRNCAEDTYSPTTGHGWAKDSPGLFTRFFNYDGDLRYEGSVYHEGYSTLGDEAGTQIVDTWQLYKGNANASVSSDLTFKLALDGEALGESFYNAYVNGTCITPNGEAAFIEKDVIFPEGKIYLLLVMNTELDDFNSLSKITVKAINGVSYAAAEEGGNNGGGNANENGSGCKSSAAAVGTGATLLAAMAFLGKKKRV